LRQASRRHRSRHRLTPGIAGAPFVAIRRSGFPVRACLRPTPIRAQYRPNDTRITWNTCDLIQNFCATSSIESRAIQGGGTLLELAFHVERGRIGIITFGAFTQPLIVNTWAPYTVAGTRGVVGAGWTHGLNDTWDSPYQYELWPPIYGCDQLTQIANGPGGWGTCNALGWTGSVTFDFTFHHVVDVRDLWLEIDQTCIYTSIPTHPSGCGNSTVMSATPEPSTWLLLATGLAATGLIHRRRRLRER
jgi:hypothetical protein